MSLLIARFPIEDPDIDRAELRDEAARRLVKASVLRGWKLTAPPSHPGTARATRGVGHGPGLHQ